MNSKISEKVIEMLILYKNILEDLENQGILNIYSHQLAKMADVTPVQLRRDLMLLSYYGKPTSGYEVSTLLKAVENFIYKSDCAKVALVGLGHVGRAILNYFQGRSKLLKIIASFDKDYEKVNRVIAGCRCYHISEAPSIIKRENIKIAIIAVPQSSAQEVADMLIEAGIIGILNYSPMRLNVPANVYVEYRDMVRAVEKVAFFACYKNQ